MNADGAFGCVLGMFGMRWFLMFEVGDSTNPDSEPFSKPYPRVYIRKWVGFGGVDCDTSGRAFSICKVNKAATGKYNQDRSGDGF